MNLIQIHEPGQTPAPHEDEIAVGIDLGTTNSLVAYSQNQHPQVIHIDGNPMLPSAVLYSDDIIVGAAAYSSTNALTSLKRYMGQASQTFKTAKGSINPIEFSVQILKHLKQQAEQHLNKQVKQAVITVPAYFDDAARKATKDAAQIAGLKVLRLINEPTAAALAYGLDNQAEGTYIVYDLGGGTFDVSVLKMQKGVFQVLSTAGDTQLGGDDFDKLIQQHIGNNTTQPRAREIKENLCNGLNHPGIDINQFNKLATPLIDKTINIVQSAIADAGIDIADIQEIILVGGSTRIPLVRESLTSFFNKPPLTSIDPDKIVALGAAIQAEALTQGSDNLLLDVIPLSLGLETMGEIVEKVIHRNTPIPCTYAQEFTTYQDNQQGMIIHVLQGEREMVKDCRSLAKFELKNIPPMLAGVARIRVEFKVSADGILTVSAEEQSTKTKQQIEVKPSYGLTEDQVKQMVLDSMQNAKQDMNDRLLHEAQTEAERVLISLTSALEKDGDLLTQQEHADINKVVVELNSSLMQEDRDIINNKVEALNDITASFAQKRMDKMMAEALNGTKI